MHVYTLAALLIIVATSVAKTYGNVDETDVMYRLASHLLKDESGDLPHFKKDEGTQNKMNPVTLEERSTKKIKSAKLSLKRDIIHALVALLRDQQKIEFPLKNIEKQTKRMFIGPSIEKNQRMLEITDQVALKKIHDAIPDFPKRKRNQHYTRLAKETVEDRGMEPKQIIKHDGKKESLMKISRIQDDIKGPPGLWGRRDIMHDASLLGPPGLWGRDATADRDGNLNDRDIEDKNLWKRLKRD